MKSPYELFNIECGPGWKKLIDPLITMCQEDGIEILQIKEKFGGLRFYVGEVPANLYFRVNNAISLAEAASFATCEECGEPGKRRGGGWIRTLCDAHAPNTSPTAGTFDNPEDLVKHLKSL